MNYKPKLDSDEGRRFWNGVEKGARQYDALPEDRRGVLGDRNPQRAKEVGDAVKICPVCENEVWRHQNKGESAGLHIYDCFDALGALYDGRRIEIEFYKEELRMERSRVANLFRIVEELTAERDALKREMKS